VFNLRHGVEPRLSELSERVGVMTECSREQRLIDIMFEIVVRYGSVTIGISRESRAAWLSRTLKESGFETKPIGSSWGVLVDE
jgi:hypothetical protein